MNIGRQLKGWLRLADGGHTGDVGFIVSYVIFISIMLFFTPTFFPNLFNVSNEDIGEIGVVPEANIFVIVVNFINTLSQNFLILITLNSNKTRGQIQNRMLRINVLAISVLSF